MPLTAPSQSHDHSVQFYEDEQFLADVIADYLYAGAEAGERLLVALTRERLAAVSDRLSERGLDTRRAIAEGRFIVLDAHATLAAIMCDGLPDRGRFERHVLGSIARGGKQRPVRAYGELVDLLYMQGKRESAARLEQFWDEACARLPLKLLCAYAMTNFKRHEDSQDFQAICNSHSRVLPTERYFNLEGRDARLRAVSLLQQRAHALEHEVEYRSALENAFSESQQCFHHLLKEFADYAFLSHGNHGSMTPDLHETGLSPSDLRCALREALTNRELELYYLPVICARSGQVVAVEGQLRWNSAQLGVMQPQRLISVAEATGLIGHLGQWVLEQACGHGRAWHDAGGDLRVAVNVSTTHLLRHELVDSIAATLSSSGLPGDMLEVEITESVLMSDPALASEILRQLKRLGVRLAVDEFGSGHSILTHLHRFPVDTLKLGRAFISEGFSSVSQQAVIKAIISMAHEMDMAVVANGVVTREQANYLRREGCDFLQGGLWAPLEYRGDRSDEEREQA